MSNGERVQVDLASAASKLGTTAQQLSDALEAGNITQGLTANVTAAAQQLGTTAQQLSGVLETGNITQGLSENLTAAVQILGATERQIRTALGIPSGAQITTLPAQQQS
jgi:hypothetical protein